MVVSHHLHLAALLVPSVNPPVEQFKQSYYMDANVVCQNTILHGIHFIEYGRWILVQCMAHLC